MAHVEVLVWADGRVCPHCGTVDNSYPLKNQRTKPSKKNPNGAERHGLYKCGSCRAQFTVRIGTIFEESHLPLHLWLQAIYLVCSSEKGFSAHQLHRVLEVQYKTAWFLEHRIREAVTAGAIPTTGGEGRTVELDTTFVGDKGKIVMHTMVERDGRAQSHVVANMSSKRLRTVPTSRAALGVEHGDRRERALNGSRGRRLLYQDAFV